MGGLCQTTRQWGAGGGSVPGCWVVMSRVSFGLGFPLGREISVRSGSLADVACIVGLNDFTD